MIMHMSNFKEQDSLNKIPMLILPSIQGSVECFYNMELGKRTYWSDQNFSHYRQVEAEVLPAALIAVAIETLLLYKNIDNFSRQNTNNLIYQLEALTNEINRHQTSYMQNTLVELYNNQNIKHLDMVISSQEFLGYLNSIAGSIVYTTDGQVAKLKKVCDFFNIDLLLLSQNKHIRLKKYHAIQAVLLQKENNYRFLYWKVSTYGNVDPQRFTNDFPDLQNSFIFSCGHSNECECPKYRIEHQLVSLKLIEKTNPREKCFICCLYEGNIILDNKKTCSKCLLHALYQTNAFNLFYNRETSDIERLIYRKDLFVLGECKAINKCLGCLEFGKNICGCLCEKCYRNYNQTQTSCHYCNRTPRKCHQQAFFNYHSRCCQYCRNNTLSETESIPFKHYYICVDCAFTLIRENGYYSSWLSKKSFNRLLERDRKDLLNKLMSLNLEIDSCLLSEHPLTTSKKMIEEENKSHQLSRNKRRTCLICNKNEGNVIVDNELVCSLCLKRIIYESRVFEVYFKRSIREREKLDYIKQLTKKRENVFMNKCVICNVFGENVCDCLCNIHYQQFSQGEIFCRFCKQESHESKYKQSKGDRKCGYCGNDRLNKNDLIRFKLFGFCITCAHTTLRENGYYNEEYSINSFVKLNEHDKSHLLTEVSKFEALKNASLAIKYKNESTESQRESRSEKKIRGFNTIFKQNVKKMCFICDLYDPFVTISERSICKECLIRVIYEPKVFLLHFKRQFDVTERLFYIKQLSNEGSDWFLNKCVNCMEFGKNRCCCLCDNCYYKHNSSNSLCSHCNKNPNKAHFKDSIGADDCHYCKNNTLTRSKLISFKEYYFCTSCALDILRENGYYVKNYIKSSFLPLYISDRRNILDKLRHLRYKVDEYYDCTKCKTLNANCNCEIPTYLQKSSQLRIKFR